MQHPAVLPEVAAPRGRMRAPLRRLARWFPDSWDLIDRESGPGRQAFGRFEAGLLVVAAVGLVTMRFPARGTHLQEVLGSGHTFFEFAANLQWTLFAVLGYVAVPVAYLRATGRRVRDYHLGWRGTGQHLHVYLVLFALMLVPVVVISATDDFQRIYPFYRLADRSWLDLALWQLAYGAQFVALEFFFRGFLLEGLRRTLGHGAIFVMVVPYVAIHFGKTAVESLAAVVAGVVLGTMAMRWRSIWGGALLHWLVAIAMDLAVTVRAGSFPPPSLLP